LHSVESCRACIDLLYRKYFRLRREHQSLAVAWENLPMEWNQPRSGILACILHVCVYKCSVLKVDLMLLQNNHKDPPAPKSQAVFVVPDNDDDPPTPEPPSEEIGYPPEPDFDTIQYNKKDNRNDTRVSGFVQERPNTLP